MIERVQLQGVDHLLQLASKVVTLEEDDGRVRGVPQPTIAGQNHASLSACVPNEGSSGELRAVQGVETDQAQPGGQMAKHPIDGKARAFVHRARCPSIRGVT